MAFEYHYSVTLEVIHPSADPKQISASFPGLDVQIETKVGDERRGKDGTLIPPYRTALLTHWSARLHAEERLYSGTVQIAAFLRTTLLRLMAFRDPLLKLAREGQVILRIGWFSESSHSATLIENDVLTQCGHLGIGLELNFYAPPH